MINGMESVPADIRQGGPDTLEIEWRDGAVTRYPVRDLRCACPCADCVDELTGERRLDPARVPADVRPERLWAVGNYALQIAWSDGHDTGIYTYERLRRLDDEKS